MHQVIECQTIDFTAFHNDIVSANQPVVIRSLVRNWPAVEQCLGSVQATCTYLQSLYRGEPVYTIAAPPEAGGRFFYNDDLTDVNFKRAQIPLQQVLAQLIAQENNSNGFSMAVQALSVRDVLPAFEPQNPMALLDESVAPTMWVGNQGKVAPHYDVHRNLACVVSGKRQFILFPPDQISNLYLGPVLNAPGGVPISLVDIWKPDLNTFPRYASALAKAQEVVLEPGDALYIPSLWWHGVASLEAVNVLVNYWWGGISQQGVSPNDTLLHGMMAIANLDSSQRQAWQAFFNHYIFKTGGNPADHLPTELKDIITSPSDEQTNAMKTFLSQRLSS